MLRKVFAALMVMLTVPAAYAIAADIVIKITDTQQYVQKQPAPPSSAQYNVEVTAGQTVAWENGDGAAHTATSDLRITNSSGIVEFLFNTRQIAAGATSADIPFTPEMYENARRALGIPANNAVHLGYYCNNHPETMGGKIVLYRDEEMKRKAKDKSHKREPTK